MDNATTKVPQRKAVTRRALRLLAASVAALEGYVVNAEHPGYLRGVAWAR